MKNILVAISILSLFGCGSTQSMTDLVTVKEQKIGINTKNPDELLTVNGSIHAKEVRIDLNGALAPDYVFEAYRGTSTSKHYQRMSLSQLETYIKKQGHLPGVPSQEILDRDGLDLKAFSLTLLEKIEELTLYLLEQQHQINQLQNTLEDKTNITPKYTRKEYAKKAGEKTEN